MKTFHDPKFVIPSGAEKKIAETFHTVEANSFARSELWKQQKEFKISEWKDESMGYGIEIGKLDNRPIVVSISWAIIDDKRVMFWGPCSQVVDYKMIDDWFKAIFPDRPNTNADNFHICVHAIHDENERELFVRNVLRELSVTELHPDLKQIKLAIADLHRKRWEPSDIVAYVRCMEEVSPHLDEDYAVRTMDGIRKKYSPQGP